jgi:hypothetical protein
MLEIRDKWYCTALGKTSVMQNALAFICSFIRCSQKHTRKRSRVIQYDPRNLTSRGLYIDRPLYIKQESRMRHDTLTYLLTVERSKPSFDECRATRKLTVNNRVYGETRTLHYPLEIDVRMRP